MQAPLVERELEVAPRTADVASSPQGKTARRINFSANNATSSLPQSHAFSSSYFGRCLRHEPLERQFDLPADRSSTSEAADSGNVVNTMRANSSVQVAFVRSFSGTANLTGTLIARRLLAGSGCLHRRARRLPQRTSRARRSAFRRRGVKTGRYGAALSIRNSRTADITAKKIFDSRNGRPAAWVSCTSNRHARPKRTP